MNFDTILVDKKEAIATITIDRPQKLNALNKTTLLELNTVLTTLESDINIQVIIITGSGEKAFVAGADIKEFANFSVEEGKNLAAKGQKK